MLEKRQLPSLYAATAFVLLLQHLQFEHCTHLYESPTSCRSADFFSSISALAFVSTCTYRESWSNTVVIPLVSPLVSKSVLKA